MNASQQQTPQVCKPQAVRATQNNRNDPINVNSPINEFVTSSSVDNPVAMTSSATIDDQQVRFINTHHYYDVIMCWRDAWEPVTGDLYHESDLGAVVMGVSRLGNRDDDPSNTNGPFFSIKNFRERSK